MDSEPHEMDLWIQETLNGWAEQGTLSFDRSAQLHLKITKLAHQERKNRLTRKAWGLVAAIITFLLMLFASCPVAAASYVGKSIHSAHSCQFTLAVLFVILICFFIKLLFHFQSTNIHFEVKYE